MINKISCCTCNTNTCAKQNSNKGQTSFGSIRQVVETTSKIGKKVGELTRTDDKFEQLRIIDAFTKSDEIQVAKITPATNSNYESILLTDSNGKNTLITKNFDASGNEFNKKLSDAFDALVQKYRAFQRDIA